MKLGLSRSITQLQRRPSTSPLMAWGVDILLIVTFASRAFARPKPEAVATGQGIFVGLRTVCSLCQVPSVGLRSPFVGLSKTRVLAG